MQEFALELQLRLRLFTCCHKWLARDDGIAKHLHLGTIGIAQRPLGAAARDAAFRRDREHAHVVDFEGVGIRIVAAHAALDLALEPPRGVEALDREILHEVVGLMRHGLFGAAGHGLRCIAHQPPGAQRQQTHQQHGQVQGKPVTDAAPGLDHDAYSASSPA